MKVVSYKRKEEKKERGESSFFFFLAFNMSSLLVPLGWRFWDFL